MWAVLSQNLVELLSLAFTSHYNHNPDVYGGVGLGLLYLNIAALSIGYGFAGGLDTVVSQAYGDNQYYSWGVHLNQARLLSTLIFLPQISLIYFATPILTGLGQDPDIIEYAQTYLYIIIPGAYWMVQYEHTKCYLHAMKVFNLPMYVQSFTLWVHAGLLWTVGSLKGTLTIIDISFIMLTNYILNLVIITGILCLYTEKLVPKESWHFFNKDAFKNTQRYLIYGIPASLMRCLDWWSLEVVSIMVGWLSKTEFLASVSLINLQSSLFMLPQGLAASTCNLVGNALGADSALKAEKYAKTGVMIAFGFSTAVWVTLLTLKGTIASVYTVHEEIRDWIESTIPYIAIFVLLDHVQCIEWGILRSMGYQNFGTIWVLIGFWLIGLPSSYVLGFNFDFRIYGVYSGLVIASFILATIFTTTIVNTHWKRLANLVSTRLFNERFEIEISKDWTD